MAHRALRLLVIVVSMGVLLMHGADASAAATNEAAPAVAHEHHGADGTDGGHAVHWHHVALACLAVLTTAVVIARRGRRSGIEGAARPTVDPSSSAEPARPAVLATGPPRWLDLAVIRR